MYVPLCGYGYDSQCSLLITAGFSLYLGNVFPDAMDYLRCAAGVVSVCKTDITQLTQTDTKFISVNRTSVILFLLFSVTLGSMYPFAEYPSCSGELCDCHKLASCSKYMNRRELYLTCAVHPDFSFKYII